MLVASFASGSTGNALLVRAGDQALLIDAGVPIRTLTNLLHACDTTPQQVQAVLLTHEHADHAQYALAFARRYNVPLVAPAATLTALGESPDPVALDPLPVGEYGAIGVFNVQSFRVAHDAADPVGYRIQVAGVSVAIAVDLGSWNAETVTALAKADLIVVEANHARELLPLSPYPVVVRQRISSPLGHLDNTQCGQLLAQVATHGGIGDVWLAHISRRANTPQTALNDVSQTLRQAGIQRLPRMQVLPPHARPVPGGIICWQPQERWQQPGLFTGDW